MIDNTINTISTIIRDTRIELDLTQTELAEILGVTTQSVSNWERGKGLRPNKKPAIERALGLARGTLGSTSLRRGPVKQKTPAAVSDEGQNHASTPRAERGTNV